MVLPKDLAYKAAILLQEACGSNMGANIKIKKVIPSGAEWVEAAQMLQPCFIVLNHLWKAGLTTDELL